MTSRRGFLAGLLATGLAPHASWADAGNPAYLAAAKVADGSYRLFGLSEAGTALFDLPLPDRGHAAAAHPSRPEAVAFARRPGTFALVIDCATGAQTARLDAPEGRHFYGHGAFDPEGAVLYTPENDYEGGRGVIGLWDVGAGYERVGEVPSGGVGPHDIRLLPGTRTLVVANGGIETHPDSGREMLNLPLMQPNLAYMGLDGHIEEVVELDPALHLNSIRHLAVRADGLVAFAMQWQGAQSEDVPLLGLHRRGADPVLLQAEGALHRRMEGYAGSVAISADGTQAAITSPRGGLVQVFDTEAERFAGIFEAADACGVSEGPSGFTVTTGTGRLVGLTGTRRVWDAGLDCAFDNHLVRIGTA